MGIATTNWSYLKAIGPIVAARIVQEEDDLTIISSNGVVLRTKVAQIRRSGRATRGVRVIGLLEGDSVASVARISAADLRLVGAENDNQDNQEIEPPDETTGPPTDA